MTQIVIVALYMRNALHIKQKQHVFYSQKPQIALKNFFRKEINETMEIIINGESLFSQQNVKQKVKRAMGYKAKQLSDIEVGGTFKIAGIEFIKFPEDHGFVPCVTRDFVFKSKFGDNNNFAESKILQKLQTEILPKIEEEIGADNILNFETDLFSMDGLDTYGTVNSKISLPTFDFYRKHSRIFDRYKVDDWWWTATPESTPERNWFTSVRCVLSDGTLINYNCNYSIGVRPFCIFKASISVS